jgi:hypothetical protein
MRLFRAQSWQFDHGAREYIKRNHPTSREIIAMTNQEYRKAHCQRNNFLLAVTAIELAHAESSALRQVNDSISKIWKEEKYGHAPCKKPDHSIRIIMENFNSLCVTLGNSKINTINNLCRDFKVDILCGCKTQVDWCQVPELCRFHNLIGAGRQTSNIVAHNINERMRVNQYGKCAIMAINTIAPEVVELEADHTGLGRWCWIQIGSGAKKTRIVMAYQPSISGQSAGTTVKDQHARYFTALGDARSPRTIFLSN